MKIIHQREIRECALACIAMIANQYGNHISLAQLRSLHQPDTHGMSISDLIRIAGSVQLHCRAVRLEIDELKLLRLPCILHWELDHYVVLEKASKAGVTIVDPALGRRIVPIADVSRSFTGVAVELTPAMDFNQKSAPKKLPIRDLTGPISGLKSALLNLIILVLSIEALALAIPQVTQLIVDKAITGADEHILKFIVMGGFILILSNQMLKIAHAWISVRIAQQISLQWSLNFLSHLLKLPLDFFINRHVGDIASRFQSLSIVQQFFTNGIVTGITGTFISLGTLCLMLAYNLQLSIVVAVATIGYAIVRVVSYAPLSNASTEKILLLAKSQSHLLESVKNTSLLSRLNITSQRESIWQNMLIDAQNRDIRTQRMIIFVTTANGVIFGLESMTLLYLGGMAVINEQITLGMLLAFTAYKSQFTSRTTQLVDIAVNFKLLDIHNERIADIALEPLRPIPREKTLLDVEKGIEFVNIYYRYSTRSPWILENISFKISAGEIIAVVGSSGSGKSTLIKLILGQLTATKGEIFICGVPIQNIPPYQLNELIGSVMQSDGLLSGSIGENISRFQADAPLDKISEAARVANIRHKVEKMPLGYRTPIGEIGDIFSGGEKQRLILARALYSAPPFVILDEATSHLDIHSERHVMGNLVDMGITQIIVAHRAESISTVSRIIRLSNGVIHFDSAKTDT